MCASTDHQSSRGWALLSRLMTVALLPTLGLVATGCAGRAVEICDNICDCERCSDREYDECILDVDEALDIADAYDCADEADRTWECSLDHNECVDRHWSAGASCAGEYEDLGRCEASSSSIVDDNPLPG